MTNLLPSPPLLSGSQHTIRHGDDVAEIASIGASLRTFRRAGRDLVVPFAADEVRPGYRGALLAPWPNRVVDGAYVFAGHQHQLALTEPARGQALHGLLVWSDFALVECTDDAVTLTAEVVPQAGYPWRLAVSTTYALAADGLTQTVTATNRSATPAPYGTGPHPYLVAGAGTVDDWTLELPADRVLLTDDRLGPADLADVGTDAARFDFRTARRIGGVEIDHAYTGLARDPAGYASVRLTDATGSGVAMVFDVACEWIQIHTADLTPGEPGHRAGLAVEPMTCAPDAFNSGTGLIVIDPGASATAAWTIRPL